MRLKTHPLFCLHAHARGHPEGGCDGELLEGHEELFKKSFIFLLIRQEVF